MSDWLMPLQQQGLTHTQSVLHSSFRQWFFSSSPLELSFVSCSSEPSPPATHTHTQLQVFLQLREQFVAGVSELLASAPQGVFSVLSLKVPNLQ